MLKKIDQLTDPGYGVTADNFMGKYFKDVPPVAALTILSKFDNDIRIIEQSILDKYLKQ